LALKKIFNWGNFRKKGNARLQLRTVQLQAGSLIYGLTHASFSGSEDRKKQ